MPPLSLDMHHRCLYDACCQNIAVSFSLTRISRYPVPGTLAPDPLYSMESVHLRRIYDKLRPFLTASDERYLVVSIEKQSLDLCANGTVIESYDASTSRFGNGNRENSLKTPLGIHLVREKYGTGAPAGRIFRDREDTGEDWTTSRPATT